MFALLTLSVLLSYANGDNGFIIRKIETRTSDLPGSGMDKPSFQLFGYSNGGSFSMTITSGDNECSTKLLNTEDNNWEEGQTDWFVGKQIRYCNGFQINEDTVDLALEHSGSNSGTLNYIKLHSWHTAGHYHCPVETNLDHDAVFHTKCTYVQDHPVSEMGEWCNGRKEFCELNFKQYLFLGTHNAGTGQSEGFWRCVSKNQDLNVTEQLHFGVRFLDLDTIYSFSASNCDGLETGHGKTGLGIYQCYGKLSILLDEFKYWLNEHPSEIAVLYFGGIASEETVPQLINAIHNTFPEEDSYTGVRLNTKFKETGEWPTLGEAVQTNRRVFVFLRDESIEAEDHGIIKEFRLKLNNDQDEDLNVDPKAVKVLSAYEARSIHGNCDFVIETSEKACRFEDVDFIKLSLFSRYGKSKLTDCIWHMARHCNQWVNSVIKNCTALSTDVKFKPNIILMDYPNYQVLSPESPVQLIEKENLKRAGLLSEAE